MDDRTAPISAYITNLGKYNEGYLVGKWHPFPTTKKDIQQTFRKIGIDGRRYEEFFVTDYEIAVDGLYEMLPEYANLDELNYLATLLDDLSSQELEQFEAAVEVGDHCGSVMDLINLAENLDCYDYLPGVDDAHDLGYYWIEESGVYDLESLGPLARYIDYERFGRDVALDEGGVFTKTGYVRSVHGSFTEVYDGVNVPDEYKVFAFPARQQNRDAR